MQKTTPFLMFVGEHYGKAREAMELYTSLFQNSEILTVTHYGPDEPVGTEENVKQAVFQLDGQEYMISDNPTHHPIVSTSAISIFVTCSDQDELEKLYTSLSHEGMVMMPLDDYGFSRKFAFVSDRFGVAWQLNLP